MNERRSEPIYKASTDGCDIAKKCTLCPLPICRYDLAQGQLKVLVYQPRDRAISERWWRGTTIGELAIEEGISTRSISRVLKAQREIAV